MWTRNRANFLIIFCLLSLVTAELGIAGEEQEPLRLEAPVDGAEAWLVTYGPGGFYWERFGHNAIWLREPAASIDHTFNFGFFDFDQPNFYLRFLKGHMLYFAAAQSAAREFEFYRQENRSIRVQKLNLNSLQYQRLRNYLLEEIKPQQRQYLYDYYLNNCSTRIRDALDIAIEGALSAQTGNSPAKLNFRDQTRRLTQTQFWYSLGLELALGVPVDRPISRWDEMFIPMVVATELAAMQLPGDGQEKALVSSDRMLFTSTRVAAPVDPGDTWFSYLLLGLLVTTLAWLSGRYMPPVWLSGLCHAWLVLGATSGLALTALWLLTDHQVTGYNANLLLLNPLFLLALAPLLKRFGVLLLAGGVALNLIFLLLPLHQYNLDALALLAPVNLAVAGYFWLNRHHF